MPTASRPPAPPVAPGRLPLIGHALELWRRPLEFLGSLTAYDRIVAAHLGPKPSYVLTSPELVHRVLVTDAASFAKGRSFDKLRPYLGNGLATSQGPLHLPGPPPPPTTPTTWASGRTCCRRSSRPGTPTAARP
ncbi:MULTISPECIES: cytochrome P450 [Streptomycetaceae]|uniref:cytochrome P450 n=1 Tax=Streptomycetaceae TaxID=2062 RepID=UPI00093D1213|nr:cytochrome P450 [Streptomyces sp. CB02056]